MELTKDLYFDICRYCLHRSDGPDKCKKHCAGIWDCKTGKRKVGCASFLLNFDTFQNAALNIGRFDAIKDDVKYMTLGLCGEAGELANKVKKIFRDDGGAVTDKRRAEIIFEIGDCLWYLAGLSRQMGIPFSVAAYLNLCKVEKRIKNKTLHGDGDNR